MPPDPQFDMFHILSSHGHVWLDHFFGLCYGFGYCMPGHFMNNQPIFNFLLVPTKPFTRNSQLQQGQVSHVFRTCYSHNFKASFFLTNKYRFIARTFHTAFLKKINSQLLDLRRFSGQTSIKRKQHN